MAKEFKDFDKIYAHLQGTFYGDSKELTPETISHINRWFFAENIRSWTPEAIRQAVYLVEGAEEWQKFRVSLKGHSTLVKLARLHARYIDKILGADSIDVATIEKCRIDNYIGALRRGGQLDADYRIVR